MRYLIELKTKKSQPAFSHEEVFPPDPLFYIEDFNEVPARFTTQILKNISERLSNASQEIKKAADKEDWDPVGRARSWALRDQAETLTMMMNAAKKNPRCNWIITPRAPNPGGEASPQDQQQPREEGKTTLEEPTQIPERAESPQS